MGNRTAIGRTHMDGTSKTYIATTGIKIPNGLAIDYLCTVPNLALIQIIKCIILICLYCIYIFHRIYRRLSVLASRLYWTDLRTNKIEYSDLNGGNRRLLATDSDAFMNDIVIHGQYLYYTAWNRE